jgi:hypothetical protein
MHPIIEDEIMKTRTAGAHRRADQARLAQAARQGRRASQQSRSPLSRFAEAVMGVFRNLNGELLGAGEAMARSNRFPQPRPQAALAQAKEAHPAGKVLTRV